MMFDYDASYAPPAPIIELVFSSPVTDRSTPNLRAFGVAAQTPRLLPSLCSKIFRQHLPMMPDVIL